MIGDGEKLVYGGNFFRALDGEFHLPDASGLGTVTYTTADLVDACVEDRNGGRGRNSDGVYSFEFSGVEIIVGVRDADTTTVDLKSVCFKRGDQWLGIGLPVPRDGYTLRISDSTGKEKVSSLKSRPKVDKARKKIARLVHGFLVSA